MRGSSDRGKQVLRVVQDTLNVFHGATQADGSSRSRRKSMNARSLGGTCNRLG
jgi:hypothetical protein